VDLAITGAPRALVEAVWLAAEILDPPVATLAVAYLVST
jgi:hypothetical protein